MLYYSTNYKWLEITSKVSLLRIEQTCLTAKSWTMSGVKKCKWYKYKRIEELQFLQVSSGQKKTLSSGVTKYFHRKNHSEKYIYLSLSLYLTMKNYNIFLSVRKKYLSVCQEKYIWFFSVKEKFSLPLEKNSNLILSGKTICLSYRKKNFLSFRKNSLSLS